MTPEELLEINPKLISVTKFMKEHPDYPVRFWDNGTVDISIPERGKLGEFVATGTTREATRSPFLRQDEA